MVRELRPEHTGGVPEGLPFNQAGADLPIEIYDQVRTDFANADPSELRAALYLLTFTGRRPIFYDTQGRQRVVDILLEADDGVEVVEVTSSIESKDAKAILQSDRLAKDIDLRYGGASTWLLHLREGWSPPRNTKLREALAARIAAELDTLDESGAAHAPLGSVDWIVVRRDSTDGGPVRIVSWNANIPPSDGLEYLDRLSAFLRSDVIASKRAKLVRQAAQHGAHRRHLYVLLAGSGQHGGLLPGAPWFLTSGTFEAPEDITDVWLDGGTGIICHWRIEGGWEFHQL